MSGAARAPDTFAALFQPEPARWGLRGDPWLWREMKERLATVPLPRTAEDVAAIVRAEFERLTGQPVSHPETIYVERHSHGGMTSGMVWPEFWRDTAIPLLQRRYAEHPQTFAMIHIPTLTTHRLILRAFRDDDLDAYAEMCADADVMRYLGEGKTLSRADAWRQLAFFVGHWQLRGFGLWALEEKASGRFIGRAGPLQPEGWPGFEVGWTLARGSWGKGYATEAAREALRYAFEELDRDHVISIIRPDNLPSIRVAERLGERLEGEVESFFGSPALIYGIHRPR